MNTLLIIVILLLIFGGGNFATNWNYAPQSLIGIFLIIVLLRLIGLI